MKRRIVFAASCVAIFFSCTKPTEVQNGTAKLEGTVGYFLAEMAIGGEVDPSGFTLSDIKWHSGEPTYAYYRVYVTGTVDSSFVQKRVTISARIDTLISRGVERGTRYFPLVKVQELTIVE